MDLFRRIFHLPKKEDGNLFDQFYWAMEEYDACDYSISDIGSSSSEDMVAFLSRSRSIKNKVMTLIFAIRDQVLPAHLHANRDYRNKFSSDVLQDPHLLGRVWLSAEFFATRSIRSADIIPVCQLAREFLLCLLFVSLNLKNHAKEGLKTPSPTIIHALLDFDRIHAFFEHVVIQHSTPTKSEEEYYYLQDLAVLFSITLDRALKQELVNQEQVEDYDPSLIFVIPRLGIFCGLTIFPDGALHPSKFSGSLNHLFRPHRKRIRKLRQQLQRLSTAEKWMLERKLAGLTAEPNMDCSPSKDSPTWVPRIVRRNSDPTERQKEEFTAQNLFVKISALSDRLQSKNAEDLTLVLKWVFDMASPPPDVSIESAEEALPNSPSFLDPPQAEAEWVPDESSPSCSQCQAPFTVFLRRHHCRSCGNVYCYRCSSNFVPLPPYPRPVRVCDRCVKLDV